MVLSADGSLLLWVLWSQQKGATDQSSSSHGYDTSEQACLLSIYRTSPADRLTTRQHGALG